MKAHPTPQESAEYWAEIALTQDWVSGWVEGAIFPCEMVFFLAVCDAAGARAVVESGRQDGFSTRILGEYARRTGARIVSIDLEEDAARAAQCRRRLAEYPVELWRGNAYEMVPKAVARSDGPLALLIDGPKGFPALALAFAAAADEKTAIISLHNLIDGGEPRAVFESLGGAPKFYEAVLRPDGNAWAALRRREREVCQARGAARSLESSSLGVAVVDADMRAALWSRMDRRFGFHQPPVLRLGWSLGQHRLTRYLFSLSYRVLGR